MWWDSKNNLSLTFSSDQTFVYH